LPPSFRFDAERLAEFFDQLPRDTEAAARLARRHDERVNGRATTETDAARPLRHALEVRHPTFATAECVELLRAHDIALVVADTAGKWPFLEDVTSDFIYVRLHGDEELYVSGYTEEALREWARKIRGWARGTTPARTERVGPPIPAQKSGRDVYVYFDNDVKVRAPYDAMSLAHRLGIGPTPEAAPEARDIRETARTNWPAIKRRWDFQQK
jgi:uncharacterized protein YecE (DUF72 family)